MKDMSIAVRPLIKGEAEGPIVKLDTPLSFWGGFDTATGAIIDRSHPSCGLILTGRIVAMPSGRGSSSSSSVLAEAIREGTAPAGIILSEPDPILAIGVLVAQRLYRRSIPIVVSGAKDFMDCPNCGVVRIQSDRIDIIG